jgi:hypothetical protein
VVSERREGRKEEREYLVVDEVLFVGSELLNHEEDTANQ